LKYLPFEAARKFINRLGLKNEIEWRNYCKSGKKPQDIPANPARQYRKEWKGLGDWLGTGRVLRILQETPSEARGVGFESSSIRWGLLLHIINIYHFDFV
jgi:hypothetical protein